jgi:hypothetical protein
MSRSGRGPAHRHSAVTPAKYFAGCAFPLPDSQASRYVRPERGMIVVSTDSAFRLESL